MDKEALKKRLREIAERMAALHAEGGENALEGDEAREWETLEAERVQREGELDAIETREREDEAAAREERERVARVAEERRRFVPGQINRENPWDGDVLSMRGQQLARAAHSILNMRDRTDHIVVDTDRRLSHVERLIRTRNDNVDGARIARLLVATEREEYRTAFMKLMSGGQVYLTLEEARALQDVAEIRAMSGGTDAEGGYGVPVLIDPTIILTAQGSPNVLLDNARVETVTTDAWRGVTSAGVTWKFRAESAATTDGAPTLAGPSVPVYTADGTIPFSFEIEMDYPGFAASMGDLLGEGYREMLLDKGTTGSGTNEMTGYLVALTSVTTYATTLTTAATLSNAEINAVWEKLGVRYRPNAKWIMDTTVDSAIQELGSALGASYTVNLTAEGVPALKGHPVLQNDYATDMPSGTGTETMLVVGDWRNYLIAQRAGMSVERVQNTFDTTTGMPNRQRAILAWARVGGDSINDAGFAILKNAAA